jgi:rare lipoprotein A
MLKNTKSLLLTTIFVAATMFVPRVSARPINRSAVTSVSRNVGYASYYSNYYNGRKTATGERFDNTAYTAASNDLPFGSRVRVTNLDNHRSVVVRINDRGPYVAGRSIDLSRRAARDIGMLHSGVVKVQITRLS